MSDQLPPDVRDRAETAAYQAYVRVAPGPQSDRWGAVVDAVAEVLAAEQPQHEFTCPACGAVTRARMADANEKAERDALKARVAELREDARRDSHDYELLRQHNEQLSEALGMSRKEYGGKNISDLDEYDRLRLTANGFQAMNGVLELQVKRQRARVDLLTTALTEIGEKWKALDYDSRCTVYGTNPELVEAMDAAIARSVLSATPTEEI